MSTVATETTTNDTLPTMDLTSEELASKFDRMEHQWSSWSSQRHLSLQHALDAIEPRAQLPLFENSFEKFKYRHQRIIKALDGVATLLTRCPDDDIATAIRTGPSDRPGVNLYNILWTRKGAQAQTDEDEKLLATLGHLVALPGGNDGVPDMVDLVIRHCKDKIISKLHKLANAVAAHIRDEKRGGDDHDYLNISQHPKYKTFERLLAKRGMLRDGKCAAGIIDDIVRYAWCASAASSKMPTRMLYLLVDGCWAFTCEEGGNLDVLDVPAKITKRYVEVGAYMQSVLDIKDALSTVKAGDSTRFVWKFDFVPSPPPQAPVTINTSILSTLNTLADHVIAPMSTLEDLHFLFPTSSTAPPGYASSTNDSRDIIHPCQHPALTLSIDLLANHAVSRAHIPCISRTFHMGFSRPPCLYCAEFLARVPPCGKRMLHRASKWRRSRDWLQWQSRGENAEGLGDARAPGYAQGANSAVVAGLTERGREILAEAEQVKWERECREKQKRREREDKGKGVDVMVVCEEHSEKGESGGRDGAVDAGEGSSTNGGCDVVTGPAFLQNDLQEANKVLKKRRRKVMLPGRKIVTRGVRKVVKRLNFKRWRREKRLDDSTQL